MLQAVRVAVAQAVRSAANGAGGVYTTQVVHRCTQQPNHADKEYIEGLVKKDKLVIFMKGTPDAPKCGFSNAVIQIFNFHGVKDYGAYDVLKDDGLRQGVKDYSHWPTIPQVFIGGEFVGGCDLVLDMHRNGDLVEELKKVGIRSALLDKAKDKA